MYNLITIGDIVIDTHVQIDNASLECQLKNKPCQLCLDYADKIPITDSFQSLGGNAANVAVGATKLGLKTTIFSSVGNDSNGQLAISELNKYGVNTEYVYLENDNQTRYSIVLTFKGERTILSFHKKRKYIWPEQTPATDWVYYTGLSAGFKKIHVDLTAWLKKHPTVRLAVNPGSYQLKYHLDVVRSCIDKADILMVNLQEAERILNTSLKKEKTVNALLHGLLNLGAGEVVITDGEKGAWTGSLEEIWQMGSFPVTVVAKTGAGDAFSSGYITARCLGYNRPQALRWGIANSCGVITKVGAQNGLLTKDELQKMLEKYANIKPLPMS